MLKNIYRVALNARSARYNCKKSVAQIVITRSNMMMAMRPEKICCRSPDTKYLTWCLIDRKERLSITINITTLAVCFTLDRSDARCRVI